MSTSVPSVSIFDIALTIDSICYHLSMPDVQACRRVNRQWATVFRRHLCCSLTISSVTTLTEKKLDTIRKNNRYIRSLTMDSSHLEQVVVSRLNFTSLRELNLRDEYCWLYYQKTPASVDAVIALMDSNPDLEHLEICLQEYNYYSGVLSPSLMLAIERHPSLKRLSWRLSEYYVTHDFFQCLLSVCQRSIQHLEVDYFCYSQPYCAQCEDLCEEWCVPGCATRFSADGRVARYDDYYDNDDDSSTEELQSVHPAYTELANLTYPLDKLGSSALRSIRLVPGQFNSPDLAFLHHFPYLQDVHIDAYDRKLEPLVHFLSSCPTLCGLDLRTIAYPSCDWCGGRPPHTNCPAIVGRFRRLQRLHLPRLSSPEQLDDIYLHLVETSFDTLEVLGVHPTSLTAQDAVLLLTTFPNIKELDLGSVKISTRDLLDPSKKKTKLCMQSWRDLDSMDTVAREWDCPPAFRVESGNMMDWWRHWSWARMFMFALRSEYLHGDKDEDEMARRKPIHMQFMYPIRAFMSWWEMDEWTMKRNERRRRRAQPLTLADAYRLACELREQREEDAVVRRKQFWGARWNEYDAVEPCDEPMREYVIAKARNRHHSLNGRKRSVFRRPFKK